MVCIDSAAGDWDGSGAEAGFMLADNTAVILRCSPFFTASLKGWAASALTAILRDAAQARGSSG